MKQQVIYDDGKNELLSLTTIENSYIFTIGKAGHITTVPKVAFHRMIFDVNKGENFEMEKEFVNHPEHYNFGKIEVIDAIEDWDLNFNLGNAVKYVARCNHKNNKIEDLEKAIWYIKREIDKYQKEEFKSEGTTTE